MQLGPAPTLSLFLLAVPLESHAASPANSMNTMPSSVAIVELFTSEGCSSCPPAVTVTLKNQDGLTATATGVVAVGNTAPATSAVLNVTPTSGTGPLTITADSSASQGNIVSRTINFGDGSAAATTTTASHTYTNPGTYTVQLTVQDQSGTVKTASTVVTVNAPAPPATSAVLNVTPTRGTGPLTITADSSASQGNIVGRTINWGDGIWINMTPTTTHTYANPGTYTVQLTVKDSAGTIKTASSVVTVTAAPAPAPAPAPVAPTPVLNVTPQTGTHPLVVSIDASASQNGGSPITGETINFGDGTWVNMTPTTTHTYTNAGSYTITLTLKNQAGLTATGTSVVTVN